LLRCVVLVVLVLLHRWRRLGTCLTWISWN
jgi:hypothetical protein